MFSSDGKRLCFFTTETTNLILLHDRLILNPYFCRKFSLTCETAFLLLTIILSLLLFLLFIFTNQMNHQNCLQETYQYKKENSNAVRHWWKKSIFISMWWSCLSKMGTKIFFTCEGNPVWWTGQDVVEDELHHCDWKQQCDLKANFFSTGVWHQEGAEVQAQEKENRQQEVCDIEDSPPLHVYLSKKFYIL